MAALDARKIHKTGRAADESAAGERQSRHRLRAALGDRARAVTHALSTFKKLADERIIFPQGGQRIIIALQVRQVAYIVYDGSYAVYRVQYIG